MPCADEWRPTIERAGATLYTGDQSNRTLLQQIILHEGKNGLDVIIDDGGHTMKQQLTSLQVLGTSYGQADSMSLRIWERHTCMIMVEIPYQEHLLLQYHT